MPAKRVLIAYHNEHLLEGLAEIFELEGYETITVRTGAAAADFARTNELDLMLCDFALPDLNGYDIYHNVQPYYKDRGLPIIFCVSTKFEQRFLQSELNISTKAIIWKPFNVEDLLEAARVAVGNDNQSMMYC